MDHQPTVVYQVATPPTRLSRWWPIGFLIASLIFFIIGGALLGVSFSYSYCYLSCSYGDSDLFYGGIACLALGGALKITTWILWIVYCTRRRRYASSFVPAQPLAMNESYVKAQPPVTPQNVSPPPRSTTPLYADFQQPPVQTARYCGQCGTPLTTPFCTQCGARD